MTIDGKRLVEAAFPFGHTSLDSVREKNVCTVPSICRRVVWEVGGTSGVRRAIDETGVVRSTVNWNNDALYDSGKAGFSRL